MNRRRLLGAACAAFMLLAPETSAAQARGGIALALGFTESEKPVVSASYVHRIGVWQLSGVGGVAFFHPGSQVAAPKDPDLYFASVSQVSGGIQLGEVLFVAPRLSYNWYGTYASVGWGITGGFSIRVSREFSFGLAAMHDRVRFDDAVDAYGPTPFTSISLAGTFWLIP